MNILFSHKRIGWSCLGEKISVIETVDDAWKSWANFMNAFHYSHSTHQHRRIMNVETVQSLSYLSPNTQEMGNRISQQEIEMFYHRSVEHAVQYTVQRIEDRFDPVHNMPQRKTEEHGFTRRRNRLFVRCL